MSDNRDAVAGAGRPSAARTAAESGKLLAHGSATCMILEA